MTLDEAITHCKEVALQNDNDAITFKNCKESKTNAWEKLTSEQAEHNCKQCANDHRQLAEWLTELKELRVKIKQLESDYEELEEINSKHMWETDNLLDDVREDYRTINALKKLLITAMEDMKTIYEANKDEGCYGIDFKWRCADEALKLIGDDICGKDDND